MLGKRLITGIIGLCLLIGIVIWGVTPVRISVTILSCIMMYEVQKALKLTDRKLFSILCIVVTAILSTGCFSEKSILYILLLYIIILFAFLIFKSSKYKTEEIAEMFFYTVFIGLSMSCITNIRAQDGIKVWLIFIAAWGSDTAAYTFGRLFGKHKLIEAVSPNKTVEGAIGGIIGSSIFVTLYSVLALNAQNISEYAILGAVASVLGQLGDLAASVVKRKCGIKDYGNIMPGHGGAMDRFDSILFVSPFIYWFINVFL